MAPLRRLALTLAACVAIAPASAAAAGWTSAGNMPDGARALHAATRLADGRVLIVGGYRSGPFEPDPVSALKTAELFDPASGTFATGAHKPAAMASGRRSPTATLLASGKVLVAGGFDAANTPLASAELFDPATGTWSAAGTMGTGRAVAVAALLPSGRVLVAGGYGTGNAALKSAELYDPATNSWVTGAAKPPDMAHARTVTVAQRAGDDVLVAGGFDGNGALKSSELYDEGANAWSDAGDMVGARGAPIAAALPDGDVLVAGGGYAPDGPIATGERYRLSHSRWATGPYKPGDMNAQGFGGRIYAAAAALGDGRVLATGGGFPFYPWQGNPCERSTEIFDAATGLWTTAAEMSTCRFTHTATALADGRVLVAGGGGYYPGSMASAEVYSPPPPPPPLAIKDLALSPADFRAAGSGPARAGSAQYPVGTTVSYRDTRAAKTVFTVLRRAPGRIVGGRCVKPTQANRSHERCWRLVEVARFARTDKAGVNSFRFKGRPNGEPLPPRLYWLAAVPHQGLATAKPVSHKFRIRP